MKIFPVHSLLLEEFGKIKQVAEQECSGNPARERILKLLPIPGFGEVVTELQRTEECRRMILKGEPFPFEGYPDISQELKLLFIRNSVLSANQIILLARVASRMRSLKDFFKTRNEIYPLMAAVISETAYEPGILQLIDAIIDENGIVRSNASPELSRIRKSLSRNRLESDQVYQSVIQKYRKNGWLTDAEESWRNGRRVISIFSEYKRSAKGIVHDLSATGKTCYIEPEEAIGINNLIEELHSSEIEETGRIMRELTEALRKYHTPLQLYFDHIITYDVISAKARLALKLHASLPQITEHPHIDLVNAKHPLLTYYNQNAGKTVIPFDLKLDSENRILVISGPNAGGKTVCMKTAGLLQIMLQSGFLVTADAKSRFGFFKNLLVDIGDSQSLEFELSTYSSRLRHMRTFLQQADASTLFLIDEFGTGTDPALGGALAEAILEELNSRKAFGIITTHYMNLKVLADNTPGIINGSMAFDAHRLEPLFRLEVGKPGSSYTFVVAQRSGLPFSVINRAKKKVKRNSLLLEDLLTRMEREKTELAKMLAENRQQEKKLKELTGQYESNLRKQEEKQESDAEKLRQRELRLSTQFEDKFRRFVKDWREAKNKKLVLDKYVSQADDRRKVLNEKEQQKTEDLIRYNVKVIRKGSKVRLRNGRVTGVVEAVDGQKVTILFGNIRTVADMGNLIYIEEKKPEKKKHEADKSTDSGTQAAG